VAGRVFLEIRDEDWGAAASLWYPHP
jgi:hypothetical protein